MVQVLGVPESQKFVEKLGGIAGQFVGSGLESYANKLQQQEQQKKQKEAYKRADIEEFYELPESIQKELISSRSKEADYLRKLQQEQQKELKEAEEVDILADLEAGKHVSPERMRKLSPTSLRSALGRQKEVFESESEKIAAQRSGKVAENIENEYKAFQSEEMRIGRMEKLDKEGKLSTPAMMKFLSFTGLPVGILSNPATEEYQKIEADFLRDVRNVFPGGRITNYEIQSYLKTVPSLMNSSEGRKAVLRNRKILNEARKLRYDAYKDILKENKGKIPPNLSMEIEERIGPRIAELSEEYKEGMNTESEKFQQPIKMIAPDGTGRLIPPNKIENALKAGARFPQ